MNNFFTQLYDKNPDVMEIQNTRRGKKLQRQNPEKQKFGNIIYFDIFVCFD